MLCLLPSVGAPQSASNFALVISGTWTVPASGDNNAITQVENQLAAKFPGVSVSEVSAEVSPIQAVPGSTTYDVTITALIPVDAAGITDSLSKLSLTNLGTAVIKAGKVRGSVEADLVGK